MQVEAACAKVSDFKRGARSKALFYLRVPLLDVLGGCVRVKRSEADSGGGKNPSSQDGSTEIETVAEESSRWSEVVCLLGLRKYIRDIVALIAPRVPIDRSKEDAIGTVKDNAEPVDLASKAEARGKIVLIRIEKSTRIIVLPPMKTEGVPLLKMRFVLVNWSS